MCYILSCFVKTFRLPCAVNCGILEVIHMGTLKTIVLILDLICAVVLVATILFQTSKSGGLSGAIAGSSDSFMSKGGSKTLDAKLAKATRWIGLAFVILSLFAVILVSATKNNASANTDTPATTVSTEAPAQTTEAPATEAPATEAPATDAPATTAAG